MMKVQVSPVLPSQSSGPTGWTSLKGSQLFKDSLHTESTVTLLLTPFKGTVAAVWCVIVFVSEVILRFLYYSVMCCLSDFCSLTRSLSFRIILYCLIWCNCEKNLSTCVKCMLFDGECEQTEKKTLIAYTWNNSPSKLECIIIQHS